MRGMIVFTRIESDGNIDYKSKVTFDLTRKSITEKGEIIYTGESGWNTPETLEIAKSNTFKIISKSDNCPDLQSILKADDQSYTGSFKNILKELRKDPKKYLQKPFQVDLHKLVYDL